jgi:hypothetical protein
MEEVPAILEGALRGNAIFTAFGREKHSSAQTGSWPILLLN